MGTFVKRLRNVKIWLYIGGAVLVGSAVWVLYRKFVSPPVGVTPVMKSGSGLPTNVYSPEDYQAMAEVVYNAMDQIGVDENAMMDIYTRLIGVVGGFSALSRAFGVRKYFWMGHSLLLGSNKDLRGWIDAELSGVNKQRWLDALRNN